MLFGLFKNLKPYKDLSYEEFSQAISLDKDGVVLDVRSVSEFKIGKIKGAKNMDVMSSSFTESLKGYSKDKNYYIYCRSGMRSGNACRTMSKLGFKNLFNLNGGILNWKGIIVK